MLRERYADWLDDHDGHDRAALIRLHLELEAGPSPQRETELRAQCDRLSPKCQTEWHVPLQQLGVEDTHLESGLPYAIIISPNRFLKNAEHLLAIAPFEALCPAIRYESRVRDVGQLASSPYLAQLPELNLGRRWIGSEGVAELTRSPSVCNLKRLRLDHNNIGDRGAIALANCNLGRLTCLDLVMNRIGRRGLRALAESASFGAGMRIRVNEFDGRFCDFQEWERRRRIDGAGRGNSRER